jgi:hypothetical protein
VLGQKKFTENEPNRGEGVRADTLSRPRDVFVGHGNLYVADAGNHRVLVWKGVPRGSGTPASGQFGQVDFESAAISGFTAESIEEPAGLAMDPTGEFLVVSDLAQGRILFFDSVMGDSPQGRSAGGVLGSPNFISQPSGGELGPGASASRGASSRMATRCSPPTPAPAGSRFSARLQKVAEGSSRLQQAAEGFRH